MLLLTIFFRRPAWPKKPETIPRIVCNSLSVNENFGFFYLLFVGNLSKITGLDSIYLFEHASKVHLGHVTKGLGSGVAQWFVRASDFGPRGPLFEPRPVHISLWP